MKTCRSLLILSLVAGLACVGLQSATAQELLVNGDFETQIEMPGWTLDESITGQPGDLINSAEPVTWGAADHDGGGYGLWLRAFAGNTDPPYEDLNLATNADFSQTVAATPGESYTFTGWSSFEQNYSGGVAFLDAASPSGAIASPTDTFFTMEFLDGGGAVIGAPTTLDLRTEQFGGFGWAQHTLNATAPAGAVEVRISAYAEDMLFNIDPGQTAFVDDFSLTASGAPSTELLANADLNNANFSPAWVLSEPASGENNIHLQSDSWANNTPDGTVGAWVKAWLEGDASAAQSVAAAPGEDYVLTAYTRWEEFYSGGLAETGTETMLEIAFLDGADAVIGTPATLDLRTEQSNDNTWRQHTLEATSPAGTASVRVSGIVTGMVNQSGGQSAFFDDFSLTLVGGPIPGDANDDGVVDLLDLDILGTHFGTTTGAVWSQGDFDGNGTVDLLDLDILGANFGTGTSAAVPEPGCLALACLAFVALGVRARR